MNAREAVLVLLVVAAATVAAISFSVANHPASIHDPRHAAAFERAREALPVLGAVRVRSDTPDAAQQLVGSRTRALQSILRPSRAESVFSRGRLLYAGPGEVERVLDLLKAGMFPEALPRAPNVGKYYRDVRGPYACDVLLREGSPASAIRAVLPDARLDGEPVVIEQEEEDASGVPRALVIALVAVGVWRAWRGGVSDLERRLLAAFVSLALLGLLGFGMDSHTLPAVIIVAAAPRGISLLAALPCLVFPSLALHRIGLVLAAGGIARWTPAVDRGGGGWRIPALLIAILLLGGWLVLDAHPLPARAPGPLRGEASVTFVPLEMAAGRARDLRGEGFIHVVGGETPLPPEPDLATRRNLRRIFNLATNLARKSTGPVADAYRKVADAAALDSLYLPYELRVRLRTRDGRAAVWVQDHIPLERDEFVSARLYRARGTVQLRREGGIAGLITFLLAGLWLIRQHGDGALVPIAARFAGAGIALTFLIAAEEAGAGFVAEAYLPVLVVAAMAPSLAAPVALACAGIAAPDHFWVAIAVAVAGGFGWVGDLSRRPRSPRSSLPAPLPP